VDDLIITGTDHELITKLKTEFHATFRMKDLGQLTYFLGLEVHHRSNGIFFKPTEVYSRFNQIGGFS